MLFLNVICHLSAVPLWIVYRPKRPNFAQDNGDKPKIKTQNKNKIISEYFHLSRHLIPQISKLLFWNKETTSGLLEQEIAKLTDTELHEDTSEGRNC